MLEKGVIDYNSHYMQTEAGRGYQQSDLKSPKTEKSADSYSLAGDYVLGETRLKFSQNVSKTKSGINLEYNVSSERGDVPDDFAFVFYMPTPLYKNRLWIDSEQFDSPEPKSFLAKKIRVIGERDTLEISGEFECVVSRVKAGSRRIWGISDNIKIAVRYLKSGDGKSASLRLKMCSVDNIVGKCAFRESNLVPLDLPMPDGDAVFAAVGYKIARGAKGIVIESGKSAVFDGVQKRAKYLEILNGFEPLSAESNVLGKVVVNYASGKSETFEITKSNSGAIAGDVRPAGATVAWHGDWKGEKVAMYTTEIPLSGKPISGVKLVNSSGAKWKIAAISYSANKFGAIGNEEYYVMPSDIYQPIENKRPALKGSVLDFSEMLDAPAGKYGRVKPADGSFTFEKAADRRVRFYGANICFTANTPTHEDAVRLADQFAATGFNIVRIHHYDSLCTTSVNGDSAQLDEAKMERFDFLFNEFKKRGIYVTIDFYTTRKLLRSEYSDLDYNGDNMKFVFAFSDMATDNFRRFVSNVLTRENKYTGLAYKDDPALFSACVRNESTYLMPFNFMIRTPMEREVVKPKFEKWLAENGAKWQGRPEMELKQLFLLDCYERTHGKLVKHIKSVAPDLLLTDQNHMGGFLLKAMSKDYDYACTNAYYGHPNYIETKYRLPMHIRSDPPIENFGGNTVLSFDAGIFGKPLMISEWNYMSPNPYCAQGAFLVGAYGALNDVGALCYFAFAHSSELISKNKPAQGFDFSMNPILPQRLDKTVELRRLAIRKTRTCRQGRTPAFRQNRFSETSRKRGGCVRVRTRVEVRRFRRSENRHFREGFDCGSGKAETRQGENRHAKRSLRKQHWRTFDGHEKEQLESRFAEDGGVRARGGAVAQRRFRFGEIGAVAGVDSADFARRQATCRQRTHTDSAPDRRNELAPKIRHAKARRNPELGQPPSARKGGKSADNGKLAARRL